MIINEGKFILASYGVWNLNPSPIISIYSRMSGVDLCVYQV
jgi:hypothetical protein